MASAWLGPFGALAQLERAPRGLEVAVERPGEVGHVAAGGAWATSAPRSARSWSMVVPWSSSVDVRTLQRFDRAEGGPLPWRLYLRSAALLNLLPAEVSQPGYGGFFWWRWWSDEDDVALTSGGVLDGADELVVPRFRGEVDPVPVVVGRIYTASVFVEDETSTSIGLRWVDADGVTLSEATDDDDDDGRWWVSGTAPANAAGVLVLLDTDGEVSRLQLTETVGPVEWHPGEGVPRVVPAGLGLAEQLATAIDLRRDVAVSLVEVG